MVFKNMKAVEKMLSDPALRIGEHSVRFSYHGSREKIVRVSSCPIDISDNHLKSAFSTFGCVTEVKSEMMKALPGLRACASRRSTWCNLCLTYWASVATSCSVSTTACSVHAGSAMAVAIWLPSAKDVRCSHCQLFDCDGKTCARDCPHCGG